jgi:hypothetical protein
MVRQDHLCRVEPAPTCRLLPATNSFSDLVSFVATDASSSEAALPSYYSNRMLHRRSLPRDFSHGNTEKYRLN